MIIVIDNTIYKSRGSLLGKLKLYRASTPDDLCEENNPIFYGGEVSELYQAIEDKKDEFQLFVIYSEIESVIRELLSESEDFNYIEDKLNEYLSSLKEIKEINRYHTKFISLQEAETLNYIESGLVKDSYGTEIELLRDFLISKSPDLYDSYNYFLSCKEGNDESSAEGFAKAINYIRNSASLQVELEEFENKLSETESGFEKIEKELDLQIKISSEKDNQLQESQDLINSLRAQVLEKDKLRLENEKLYNLLKSKLDFLEEKDKSQSSEIKRNKIKLKSLSDKNEVLRASLESSYDQIFSLQEKIQNLYNELDIRSEKIKENSENNLYLTNKNSALVEKCKSIDKLRKQKQILDNELNEKELLLDSKLAELERVTKELNDYKINQNNNIISLKARLTAQENSEKRFKLTLDKKSKEHDKLLDKVLQLQAEYEALLIDAKKRDKAANEKEKQLISKHLKADMQSRRDVKKLKSKCDSLTEQLVRGNSEIAVLKMEIDKMKGSISYSFLKPVLRLEQKIKKQNPIEADIALLHASGLFDIEWYLKVYPDVKASGLDPIVHYLNHGWKESRQPSPYFDGVWYLQRYEDVQKSGLNPLVHYLKYGIGEGRTSSPRLLEEQ
ncbi:hypothetical protein EP12_17395 [Alteromonas australica]|nr:hypothetical protein EP12_17395 [Alteromonas australica]